MRQFKRSDRLSEQILRDISNVVETDFKDEVPGLVTFTHVRLSNDLRYATVYYSVLGSEDVRESTRLFLERTKKRIRQMVGTNLHVRRIPEFTFKYDKSIEQGIKIERLLNEIKSDTKEQQPD
jgi:ribosome-binding factor A